MSEQAVLPRTPLDRPLTEDSPARAHAAGAAGESAAVAIEGLSAFYGNKQVLRDVTLAIPARRITALIGPSGCGKTTLLRTLNLMSRTVAGFRSTGAVRVNGQDIAAVRNVEAYRRSVGILFQRPNPFPMSILDNVTLALRLYGVGKRERNEIAREQLLEVGLWDDVKDRLGHSPSALSGGQQQRLCLARALAVEPEVLLLDEPASALDPKSARVLEELFVRLAPRVTLVLVTHNLAQARRIADRTAFMESGSLVECADTKALFAFPKEERTRVYVEEFLTIS